MRSGIINIIVLGLVLTGATMLLSACGGGHCARDTPHWEHGITCW